MSDPYPPGEEPAPDREPRRAAPTTILDLSNQSLERYWLAQSPQLFAIIQDMELLETWPIDDRDEQISAAIERLGEKVGMSTVRALSKLNRDELILVLGYIRAGRSLRLYQFLHLRVPQVALDLMQACRQRERDPQPRTQARTSDGTPIDDQAVYLAAHALLERLRNIERSVVFTRVFGPDNVIPLLNALNAA